MSLYDEARDLVIEGLDKIADEANPEYYELGTEESMRGLHAVSYTHLRAHET